MHAQAFIYPVVAWLVNGFSGKNVAFAESHEGGEENPQHRRHVTGENQALGLQPKHVVDEGDRRRVFVHLQES